MNVKKICVLLLIGAIVLVGSISSVSAISESPEYIETVKYKDSSYTEIQDIIGSLIFVSSTTGEQDISVTVLGGDNKSVVIIKSNEVDVNWRFDNGTDKSYIYVSSISGKLYCIMVDYSSVVVPEHPDTSLLSNHMSEIANLTAENVLLVQENSDLKNETGSLNSSVIGLTTDREDAIAKRNVIQEEYDELKDERDELEDEIDNYVEEIDWLNTKLWMFSIMALVLGGLGGVMIRDKTFREGLGITKSKAKSNVLEGIEDAGLNKVKSKIEIAEENILNDLTEIMHADLRAYNKAELTILGNRLKMIKGYDKNKKIAPLLKAVQTAYDEEVKRLQDAKKK